MFVYLISISGCIKNILKVAATRILREGSFLLRKIGGKFIILERNKYFFSTIVRKIFPLQF